MVNPHRLDNGERVNLVHANFFIATFFLGGCKIIVYVLGYTLDICTFFFRVLARSIFKDFEQRAVWESAHRKYSECPTMGKTCTMRKNVPILTAYLPDDKLT